MVIELSAGSSSGKTIICPYCKGKSKLNKDIIEYLKNKGFKKINASCYHCNEIISLDISKEPTKYNIYSSGEKEIIGDRFK